MRKSAIRHRQSKFEVRSWKFEPRNALTRAIFPLRKPDGKRKLLPRFELRTSNFKLSSRLCRRDDVHLQIDRHLAVQLDRHLVLAQRLERLGELDLPPIDREIAGRERFGDVGRG